MKPVRTKSTQQDTPQNSRSQDFRVVYANTFAINFTQTEANLTFGIQKKPGTDSVEMEEQIGVVMSQPAAKLLVESLRLIIEDYETATAPIAVEDAKLNGLRELIVAHQRARAAAANSQV